MPKHKKAEKQKIKTSISHPWRVFGFESLLFAVTLTLGILAGFRLKTVLAVQKIALEPASIKDVLFPFALGTLVLLFIIYFLRKRKIKGIFFKIVFGVVIGLGNLFFFGLWLPDLIALPLVSVLIILLFKKPCLLLHDLALMFAIAGIGAGLGLRLQPEMVVFLLLLFSIYDFIAVYKTKHMVKMAKEMVKHRAILGFIAPQRFSDFQTELKKVKFGKGFLILGSGDIVFPLILAVSLISQGIVSVLIAAAFSMLGLLAVFLIFICQKKRRPMPALPPIALFAIIGFLITKLL